MKYKQGFTLIELLVVVAIIALMTVMTIPFFSRYGIRSEFNLRSIEIKSLIEQMNNMAKNPEKDVARYLVKYNTTNDTVGLYKKDDTSGNLIKEISMSSTSDFAVHTNGADLTEQGKHIVVCDSPGDNCCRVSTATELCTTNIISTNFFDLVIVDDATSYTSTFNIKLNPFRVSH